MKKQLIELVSFFKSFDHQPDDDLKVMYSQAYQLGTLWFGVPKDDKAATRIVRSSVSCCAYDPIFMNYTISIINDAVQECQIMYCIGHEVYHRVSHKKTGLRNIYWVDEMMAEATAFHVLQQTGFHDYASFLEIHYGLYDLIDILQLPLRCRVTHWITRYLDTDVPENFAQSVFTWGRRVEKVVGWDTMTHLIDCQTWSEWLDYVSADKRQEICSLLNINR